MDKGDFFWIGNCVGVVALVATVLIAAPIKEKERKEYEAKQQAAAIERAQVKVVSVVNDLDKGTLLTAKTIGLKEINKTAFTTRMFLDAKEVVGKKTIHKMKSGNVIFKDDVEPASGDDKTSISESLAPDPVPPEKKNSKPIDR